MDYKKVKETQQIMKYNIRDNLQINDNFKISYSILNDIL